MFGRQVGQDGGCCRGNSGYGHFPRECRVSEDLRGSIEVTLRVSGDDHDGLLGVDVVVCLPGGRGEGI